MAPRPGWPLSPARVPGPVAVSTDVGPRRGRPAGWKATVFTDAFGAPCGVRWTRYAVRGTRKRSERQTVREQVQSRLTELRREWEKGQVELQSIDRQQAYLRETLLRVGGAMQVLEELLADSERREEHDESGVRHTPFPVRPLERAEATVGGAESGRRAADHGRAGREPEGWTPVA
jgi:hypothetical protein